MAKTHPEKDFTERAINMLKAYEDLEDLSPSTSEYTHETFTTFFIKRLVAVKGILKPIDYLQIPFRIAQSHEDPDTRKLYTNYIEKLKDNYKNFKWKLDRLDSYSTIPSRIEKIYDDGDDLFENTSPIGKEFYFCYRLAQYAQICNEQSTPEYAACFCCIYPEKSKDLPEDLQKILESDGSVNSKDFWEKYKQYFTPQYMNFGEMDSFLKKFLLGISKTKPQKIALKAILLRARLFNVIWLPYNKIEELDPGANEDFFLKVHFLKNKGNIQSLNLEHLLKKLDISEEESFGRTLKLVDSKFTKGSLLRTLTNVQPREKSISSLLSSGTGKKETLKENLDRISYTSSFPILDKIQYPLNEESEPRWLYPLIKVIHNATENPNSIDSIPLLLKFYSAVKSEEPLEIESEDPSQKIHIYLTLITLAEFLSKGTKYVYNPILRSEIPEFSITQSFIFRFPNVIGQIVAHPKINVFTTANDIISTIDILRLQQVIKKALDDLKELKQDPQKFHSTFGNVLKDPNLNKHEEFKQSMSSNLEQLLKSYPILQQLEKTDLQNHN
ncbi:MAG: hypothetical protein MJY99_08895 [Fibrobacter sp.]|nr:hypothetical protein [Fibrobacter sp.]